jgi:hypothetical protein
VTRTSYHEVYALLSSFAHPNVSTCRSWFFEEREPEESEFFIAEMNKTQFLNVAKHLLAIEWRTIVLISVEFAVAFTEDEKTLEQPKKWVACFKQEMREINSVLSHKETKH